MPSTQYGSSVSGGGVTIQSSIVRDTDSVSGLSPTLPAGYAGTLTTRTDNDTGIVTTTLAHNILTSDFVDVYWSGGRRYNVDVTAVGANTVSIDIGSGDNLPIATTAVVVVKRERINVAIDGDEAALVALQLSIAAPNAATQGHISFYDVGDAQIAHFDLTANQSQIYDIEGGVSNPFTGNPITYAKASNGSSENAATMKIIASQDSTP